MRFCAVWLYGAMYYYVMHEHALFEPASHTAIQQNRIVPPPMCLAVRYTAHTAHTPYITIQHPSGCPLAGREELVLASSQPQGRAGSSLSGDAVVEGHVADVVESVLSL